LPEEVYSIENLLRAAPGAVQPLTKGFVLLLELGEPLTRYDRTADTLGRRTLELAKPRFGAERTPTKRRELLDEMMHQPFQLVKRLQLRGFVV
jgi:hypothetical protein